MMIENINHKFGKLANDENLTVCINYGRITNALIL